MSKVYYAYHRGPKTQVIGWEKGSAPDGGAHRGWPAIDGPFLTEEEAQSAAKNFVYTPTPTKPLMDAKTGGSYEDRIAQVMADPTSEHGEWKWLGLEWWINDSVSWFLTSYSKGDWLHYFSDLAVIAVKLNYQIRHHK
jgi:hypothetical protein